MQLSDIKSIAIIGAGTMGQGIANVAAVAGFRTIVHDQDKNRLEKGWHGILSSLEKGVEKGKISRSAMDNARGRIALENNLENLRADCFIEAIIEEVEAKTQVLAIVQKNNPGAIIASNTSSISITLLGSCLQDPAKIVGMHFFNPAHVMKLVEVIAGEATDQNVVKVTMAIVSKMGKEAIHVNDSPGFVVNRVARHFFVESLKVLEDQVTDIEGIDKLLEASGFRMGPFRLMDLIGVDTNYSVTKTMFYQFHQEGKFRPSRIQKKMVDAGYLGRKTSKGFYNYE